MTNHAIGAVRLPGGSIPLLGLGTWQLTGDDCYRAVRHALDTGYRHIDTATGYDNEDQVGRAVADSGIDRAEIFITTKLPPDAAGRERETLTRSLRALRTGYVDLWLIHWPPGGVARPDTWNQFIVLRDEEMVRSIGVSNYSIAQLDTLIETSGQAPAVNQIPWSPAHYDPQLVADLTERGVTLEGYSPLKRTDLTNPVLTRIAAEYGATPAQVVLRWHVDHGFVVIPKSAHPQRIEENFHLGFTLSPQELAQINGLSKS